MVQVRQTEVKEWDSWRTRHVQKKKNATLDELVPAAYLPCFGWADFRSLDFGWRLGSSGVDLVVVSSKSM
jgi:hypothetical protein